MHAFERTAEIHEPEATTPETNDPMFTIEPDFEHGGFRATFTMHLVAVESGDLNRESSR